MRLREENLLFTGGETPPPPNFERNEAHQFSKKRKKKKATLQATEKLRELHRFLVEL